MWSPKSDKISMPGAERMLPGRAASMPVPARHYVNGNALKYDLSAADVVTLYLLTSSNERLKPILIKDLKPTSRVVSHDFEIRGWKPVNVSKMVVGGRAHSIYLYRMDSL